MWDHLAGTESAAFEPGENEQIAVKVIDDRGNELHGGEGAMSFEVAEPIQNGPFDQPTKYWYIAEGEQPKLIEGKRRRLP